MKIAILGDFHYSLMENGTSDMKQARDNAYSAMLDQFLQAEADFHVSLGDFTHEGYPEEFKYLFNRVKKSGRKFVHVLGNHDTYSIPKNDILELTGQERYQVIETKEARLIFLDSTKEMNRADWGGELDTEQVTWLELQIESSGEKPVLVFAHHPVYDTTTRSTMEKLSIHPSIDMKTVLNKKNGVGFYFCGHNHANSIVQHDKWHYIQTAACLDVTAYRLVELNDNRVNIELVYMIDNQIVSNIQVFNTEMLGFLPSEDAHGQETDWSISIHLLETSK